MKYYKLIAIFFLMITLFTGCSAYSATPAIQTDMVFDTVVTIQIYDKHSEDILEHCIQMCHDYEALFSRTLEGSDIYNINHAGGKAVAVSDETITLLTLALEYCRLSGGAFDITLGELSDLWNVKDNSGEIPDASTIQKAVTNSGYSNILITGNMVQLTNSKIQLDLGGIAKGYVADQIKTYLKEEGVDHALINLGGNILALGGKPGNSVYSIGIQRPFDETGEAITSVKVSEESVVTSGIYQRYFEKNDRIYHHIINPADGYPYDNDLLSVTIVCDSSAKADALSTICYAYGYKRGMSFINEQEDVEALFITEDYKLHYSNGFPK